MKYFLSILILLPFALTAQKKKTAAVNLLSALSRFQFSKDGEFIGKKIIDTLYYNDTTIKAIGYFALDKENKKSEYKVGLWKEFYENGIVRSAGNFSIQYLLISYSSNKSIIYNQYKVGEWIYYYDNAQVKAKGRYRIEKKSVATGIDNQFARTAVTTDSWLFLGKDGKQLTDKQAVIAEIE